MISDQREGIKIKQACLSIKTHLFSINSVKSSSYMPIKKNLRKSHWNSVTNPITQQCLGQSSHGHVYKHIIKLLRLFTEPNNVRRVGFRVKSKADVLMIQLWLLNSTNGSSGHRPFYKSSARHQFCFDTLTTPEKACTDSRGKHRSPMLYCKNLP